MFVLITLEIAILVISIVFWNSWVDLFIITNSVINTYFSWQDNVIQLKASVVLCAVLLILYDIFVGAYAYIVSEVLYGGTALISLIIMLREIKKEKKENGEQPSSSN